MGDGRICWRRAPSIAPGGTIDQRVNLVGIPAFFELAEARAFEGVVSTSFVIESLATIPSSTDKSTQAHKVTNTVINLLTDPQWVSAPNEAPNAFLQGQERRPVPVTSQKREHLSGKQLCCKVDYPSESLPYRTGRSPTTSPLKHDSPVSCLFIIDAFAAAELSLRMRPPRTH